MNVAVDAMGGDHAPRVAVLGAVQAASEVGVNITADRLISDMDTAEHLLQRFGRLNRFGETEGIAHLLTTPSDENGSNKLDHKAARQPHAHCRRYGHDCHGRWWT